MMMMELKRRKKDNLNLIYDCNIFDIFSLKIKYIRGMKWIIFFFFLVFDYIDIK